MELYLRDTSSFAAPRDRSGRFRVSARAPGFSPVMVHVNVGSVGCHVETVPVQLTLRRLAGAIPAATCPEF